MAKRKNVQKRELIMGSQFKRQCAKIDGRSKFQKILVGWSTRSPFGEQIQKVIEPNKPVVIEVLFAASTTTP